ncbi:MAG TPA: amidohydrolase family protein [Anaerolineae bacterium]
MKIDIHTHFIPPQFIDDARQGRALNNIKLERRKDAEWVIHPQGYKYPLAAEFWDMEAKLRQMDKLDLNVSILSISPTLFFYWAEAKSTAEFCQLANESVAKMAAQSGGRLHGMATVPLQDPKAAATELRRAVTQLGLRGVEIGAVMENVPLDDPRFDPFFSAVEELNVPVMLHPYYVGPKPQLGDFYMTNLIGNPLETTIAAARLILSGCLDRHPQLKVILVHAGGFLPFQIGRLDHGYAVRAETNANIKKLPSSYLSRFYFDTITHANLPLKFLIDLVGKEHVVIGTDIPFDMADTHFTERLSLAKLDPATAKAIQSQNATRIFDLK